MGKVHDGRESQEVIKRQRLTVLDLGSLTDESDHRLVNLFGS